MTVTKPRSYSNAYEHEARAVKAGKIAAVLRAQGVTAPALVFRLDAAGRRAAEGLALVPEASDQTWAVVATLVAGITDPFGGLPR